MDTNASQILHTIMGHITETQQETYRMFKSARGDLVCDLSDNQSDSASDGEEISISTTEIHSLTDVMGTSAPDLSSELIIPQLSLNDYEDDEIVVQNVTDKHWDNSLTFKYIDGQISFSELAVVMENRIVTVDENLTSPEEPGAVIAAVENGELEEEQDNEPCSSTDPDWRPDEAFEREFHATEQTRMRRSRRCKSKASRRKLPPDLMGLVGEANLCFARGNHEDAIRMCLEVIRIAPTAPEPFQTLGMLYEEMGDTEKAFQYHLIAAYLCPSDGDNWIKVAEMAVELGNINQGISCYSRAIRVYPSDVNLHWQRCKLYEQIGDVKRTLDGYENLIKVLKPSDGEFAILLAKEIAKIHFKSGKIGASIQVMEAAFGKHEMYITSEDVNLYVELLISEKRFEKALLSFHKYCGIQFELSGVTTMEPFCEEFFGNSRERIVVKIPYDILPIDLRAKLIVCLIHLKIMSSVDELKKVILNESAEEMGDLYLDIAEAYVAVDLHAEAEPLFAELIYTQTYNLAAVWLRYARCLKDLNKKEESVAAYYEVIRQAGDHHEAKLELSELLLELGRPEDATEATGQSESTLVSLDLLLLRCRLLYAQEKWSDFVGAAKLLLRNDMHYLTHEKEMFVMISSSTFQKRLGNLRDTRKELDIIDNRELAFTGNKISTDELMDIYVKLCDVLCFKLKNRKELQRIVFSAYTCPSFKDLLDSLDFYALMAMFYSENLVFTYTLVKNVIGRNLHNNQVWNLLCPIMSRFYQDLRHNRFCLRLFTKNPDLIALAYFNGHNALMSGSYKHALAEYMNIHRQNPKDPFSTFCVALGFLHLACQKFINNRHSLVIQMSAFLELYLESRGECQESFYNVGRAFHQLGLVHEAVHFYKRVFDCDSNIEMNGKENLRETVFDLRRETAYNLSLIYQNSGSKELALHYLKRYFVV